MSPPSSLGQGEKGCCSFLQSHGAPAPTGSHWRPQPQGAGATVEHGGTPKYRRLLHLRRQLLQPGVFQPADLCLDAGQAVTHYFQRTLTFLTQSTGRVPPAPEQEQHIMHLALSHKRQRWKIYRSTGL